MIYRLLGNDLIAGKELAIWLPSNMVTVCLEMPHLHAM